MEAVTITIHLDVTDETYAHVRSNVNLNLILKRAAEKKFYELVLEDLSAPPTAE